MVYDTSHIADNIRKLYRQNPAVASTNIEHYLEQKLTGLPIDQKLDGIQHILCQFKGSEKNEAYVADPVSKEELTRFISLLLGQPVSAGEITSGQLQQKMRSTLQELFQALNELLQAIDCTLVGGSHMLDNTIRHIIRDQLEELDGQQTLEEYIGKIRKSFFLSYESSKQAHQQVLGRVLSELDPDTIRRQSKSGIKFGPLRKAGFFEQYEKSFRDLSEWHKSGRGLEEYLRAFEKICSDASNTCSREVLSQ